LDAGRLPAWQHSLVTDPAAPHPRVMPPAIADALLDVLALHATLGALFAIAFQWRGLARIDPAAAQGSLGFRVLVTPGVIALWPLLARRWWQASNAESAA
jgi:hypothetical protein